MLPVVALPEGSLSKSLYVDWFCSRVEVMKRSTNVSSVSLAFMTTLVIHNVRLFTVTSLHIYECIKYAVEGEIIKPTDLLPTHNYNSRHVSLFLRLLDSFFEILRFYHS